MNERTNEERPDTVSQKDGTERPSSSEANERQSVTDSVSEKNRDGQHTQTTCPECQGRVRRPGDSADAVCDDCGLVVPDATLDTGIERYTPSGTSDQDSRLGPLSTNLLHDKGLSTKIGWQDTDAKGNSLSGERRRQMRRLRQWNGRFQRHSSADRNLMHALGEINRMASALGVPDSARETAGAVYLNQGESPGL
ncbi:TFIIB-type zinc ribbon-containing protein [Halorubrum coriense]|uniref:TFIIB-type zinc ribbon-containing protein n=1 Tax=Halorubrum coriense TaxID=64713 RepID=UPI00126896B9